MDAYEISWLSAIELAAAFRDGTLTPMEAVDAASEMMQEYNPKLNAVVTPTIEAAQAAARATKRRIEKGEDYGMLDGVPITIKDNVFTRGIRTTFGSRLYRDFIPDRDAIVVERLRAAGVAVLGKTNLPEFGLVGITDNPLFGRTANPWDHERTSGGSSGGAAAAVASGMCPVAIGNDGGGSIRLPSSFCGTYGFKPSFGRVPDWPAPRCWETMNSQGPITRTVADAALIMDTIGGHDRRDRWALPGKETYSNRLDNGIDGKKIAYTPDLGYASVDTEVAELTKQAAHAFEKAGCDVVDISDGILNMEEDLMTQVVCEALTSEEARRTEWEDVAFEPYLGFLDIAASMTVEDHVRIQFRRKELWDSVRKLFDNYDFLLTPTTAVVAFTHEDGIGPAFVGGEGAGPLGWMPFTYPFNYTGQPAASIPCGFALNGMPVGLQIVGEQYDDLGVLQASRAFEKRQPWTQKRPR